MTGSSGPRRLLDAMEYQDRERRRANAMRDNSRPTLRQRLSALFGRIFDRMKSG